MLFEGASAGGGRVDERLWLLVERATEAVEIALTLLTMMPPRLCATKMIGRLLVCPDFSFCLFSSLSTAHLRPLPLQAQVRHQRLCMVEQVLAANPRPAVRVRVIAPAEYARVGQVVREEVAQPVDAATCRPCLLAVSVQAMDGDDTAVLLLANAQPGSKKHTRQ